MNLWCNVCLHKRTAHKFSTWLRRFISAVPGKGSKDVFISNVSAGNRTLCRGRHVVRVLRVEGARCVGLFYLILCCLYLSDVLSCRILQCATEGWISASNATSATPELVPLFVLDQSLYHHRPIYVRKFDREWFIVRVYIYLGIILCAPVRIFV